MVSRPFLILKLKIHAKEIISNSWSVFIQFAIYSASTGTDRATMRGSRDSGRSANGISSE